MRMSFSTNAMYCIETYVLLYIALRQNPWCPRPTLGPGLRTLCPPDAQMCKDCILSLHLHQCIVTHCSSYSCMCLTIVVWHTLEVHLLFSCAKIAYYHCISQCIVTWCSVYSFMCITIVVSHTLEVHLLFSCEKIAYYHCICISAL